MILSDFFQLGDHFFPGYLEKYESASFQSVLRAA